MEQNNKVSISLFEQALGKDWQNVAPVVQKHYGLRPYSKDEIELEGIMSVYYSLAAFVLLAPARLFAGPVLLREDNIPVHVKNNAQPQSKAMHWHRSFKTASQTKPLLFHSCMEYAGGNEVIEYIGSNPRFCMGIKMAIRQEQGAIIYESTGYLLKLGTLRLPLPGHMFLGRAWIEEKASDDQEIAMKFFIKHPLWGRIYSYSGTFSICPSPDD